MCICTTIRVGHFIAFMSPSSTHVKVHFVLCRCTIIIGILCSTFLFFFFFYCFLWSFFAFTRKICLRQWSTFFLAIAHKNETFLFFFFITLFEEFLKWFSDLWRFAITRKEDVTQNSNWDFFFLLLASKWFIFQPWAMGILVINSIFLQTSNVLEIETISFFRITTLVTRQFFFTKLHRTTQRELSYIQWSHK